MSPGLPAGSAVPVPEGGACLLCRLPTLPFVCFPAPIPPTPFPAGRGSFKVYFAGGFAPGTPATGWEAALAFPLEGGAPRGGLSPGLPAGSAVPVPEGGLSFASPAAPALSLLSCPHPPDPLPGGKGEFQSLFCRGLRPRHPCDRVGSGTGFTFGKRCRKGASPLASPGRDRQCRTDTSRIQNPQQKRLSRFCKTQNPSHHPIQQGNHRSGHQRKSSAK